jgi:hypothetical protein
MPDFLLGITYEQSFLPLGGKKGGSSYKAK